MEEETKGYNEPEKQDEGSSNMQASQVVTQGKPSITATSEAITHAGARRAVFTLDEGDVIITFPERLSTNSVDDLEEYLKIFMKKARRDADSPN